ncbi:MAG: glutathione peroxidase [Lentisphaerae bacterium]|nr:glutathione peroxidase [Lentisphaerota bacterium]
MTRILTLSLMMGLALAAAEPPASIYDLSVLDAEGKPVPLRQYEGRVMLIVNVASKCGFTRQYEGLQALHQTYAERGLVVLGFPCNQFGSQEPGSNADIQAFCSREYAVTFPVLGKIDVNGDQADPLFKLLRTRAPGVMGSTAIKWNFTKFLVDRQGRVVGRFASATAPADLKPDIEALLAGTPQAAAPAPTPAAP